MPGLAAQDVDATDRALASGAGGPGSTINSASGGARSLAGLVDSLGGALVADCSGGPPCGLKAQLQGLKSKANSTPQKRCRCPGRKNLPPRPGFRAASGLAPLP